MRASASIGVGAWHEVSNASSRCWFIALLALGTCGSPRAASRSESVQHAVQAEDSALQPDADDPKPARPPTWAEALEKRGLPNLYRVSPTLYRGAQPTAEGIRELERMGVRTLLSLRTFHDDPDVLDAGDSLVRESIRAKPWHAEKEDVARFLKIVTDPKKQPVFVHCQQGSDRTGMMCAVYRVVVDGWSKDEAIREMTSDDFGFHEAWHNLVRFVREFDAALLQRKFGLK